MYAFMYVITFLVFVVLAFGEGQVGVTSFQKPVCVCIYVCVYFTYHMYDVCVDMFTYGCMYMHCVCVCVRERESVCVRESVCG